MALIKKITNPRNGVITSYWETLSVYWNKPLGTTRFIMGGWFNKQAFLDGLEPVEVLSWEIANGSNPQLSAAAEAFLLNFAKSQPELQGAIEVV